ncbi:WD40-repeat-containing domain protein [Scleroderma yunnanense]
MSRKPRKTNPSDVEGVLRHSATTPTSVGFNVYTRGKVAIKHLRTRILPKTTREEEETYEGPVPGKTETASVLHAHDLPAAGDDGSSVPVKKNQGCAAITSMVAGEVQKAENKISTVKSIPGMTETVTNAISVANTAMIGLGTIDKIYLQPLSTFNTFVNGIANIHPYAQMALNVLNTASKMVLSQANLDASISDLISRIKQTYELILGYKSPSKINSMKDVLVQISQVVQECAQFISRYSETKSFWYRLGKNVFSETTITVTNYSSKLDRLMQELRDRAVLNIHDDVQRIREDLADLKIQDGVQQIREDIILDSLACASRVGVNQAKKCLDGTRTEILNEIIDWINDTDYATPRIFWLHGQAGKGKSAIAHTIALQAKNLGNLGSCFCFTRVRQHEGLHMKLFTTIARDLADRDLRFRLLLAELIANNHALRDTEDIAEQWQKFILEPLSKLEGSLLRNVVVVIDALDESGSEASREDVLDIFASHGAELPMNVRILLTSRPLMDIREALHSREYILVRSLDDICSDSTTRDITLYISTQLRKLRGTFSDEDFEQLAVKSDGLFEWARLACDYIRPRVGVTPKESFRRIMSRAGDRSNLLDEMYTAFLKDLMQGSIDVLSRFRSVMRHILWSKEPLPISAMDAMRSKFSQEDDHFSAGVILSFMASLLTGTTNTSTPVRPLHASFYDFLLDEKRSGEFFIDQGDVHHDLALASLYVMQAGLRFNICALPTSYVHNSAVVDLAKRVEENIPPHLLYACRFWAIHLKDSRFTSDLAHCVRMFVTREQVLFWMEALGVSNFIGEAYGALAVAEHWLQGNKMEDEDVLRVIKDGIKFVSNFAGIIAESTPHLYLSALPFSPSQSTLIRGVTVKFANMAQVVSGQHEDWPKNQHVLQGHTSFVWSVAFSPDGRNIVSGSSDNTIRIWDAQTGAQVGKPLQGHTKLAFSVAFSPDGRTIVSGSVDHTVQVWDVQTGTQVGNPLQGHTSPVMSVAFSPDGRHVVSGSVDCTIRLWDVQTGAQVGNPLEGHTSSVMSIAFSMDGKHIVSGSTDCTIRIWNAQTGDQVGNPLHGHAKSVFSVAFSPNGRHIVSGSDDHTIHIWDVETGFQMGNPLCGHTKSVMSVAFSPDGRYIVSGSYDHTIKIWDSQTGVQVGHPLQGHTKSVMSVSFSPDGRHIVSGSFDHTVRIWDAQTGPYGGSPLEGHTTSFMSIAFSPDGKHIVSGSDDCTIQIWDAHTGAQAGNTLQGHTKPVMSVAFSPDGKYIASGSIDYTIQLWDAQTGAQVGNPLQGHTNSIMSVSFSPDGKHIVSGSYDHTIQIWDVQTGAQVGHPLQGHTKSVMSVAFSPDGKHIVSGSDDNTVQLWDVQMGTQVGTPMQGHTGPVWSVAFSPDGRYIASSSFDQTIRIWDAQTSRQVGNPIKGHTDSVWSVAFSPDGRHIVSGSHDHTVRIWDMQTGSHVALKGHTNSVLSVAFSPDGGHIVSASSDHTIRVWGAWKDVYAGHCLTEDTNYSKQIRFPLVSISSLDLHGHGDVQSPFENIIHLEKDGWIVGPNGELLLWIPPSYHPFCWYSPWTSLIIPRGIPELDLSKMVHGSAWNQCFSMSTDGT